LSWHYPCSNSILCSFLEDYIATYGFGYDPYNENYKVVAVSCYDFGKTKVNVHTLGTNFWRRTREFPSGDPVEETGKFVGGTVN
jgi:hypothetical protein